MCLECWDEEGRPWEVTDAVRAWAPVFGRAYHYGAMHVVVEDWNLEDINIQHCMLDARATDEDKALCTALLAMSEGERWATAILAEQPDFRPQDAQN